MYYEVDKVRADEVELSLKGVKDLIIRNVMKILACVIIFSVLVPTIKYVYDIKVYNEKINNTTNNETNIVLTEKDNAMIGKYYLLKGRVEQLNDYKQKAILLKLDSASISQGILFYYTDTEEELKNEIRDAVMYYVNNGNLASDIEAEAESFRNCYLSQVITCSPSYSANEMETGLFYVMVAVNDSDSCEEIMRLCKQLIEEFSLSLNSSIAQHKLTVVNENIVYASRNDIYISQTEFYDEYNKVLESFEAHKNSLTESQKNYIDDFAMNTNAGNITEIQKPVFSMGLFCIGAAVGVVFAACLLFVELFFGGKLQTETELLKRLDINCLGVFDSDSQGYIYKFKNRKRDTECDLDKITLEKIKLVLKNSSIREIGFIGTELSLDNKKIGSLIKALEDIGIKGKLLGNILDNKDVYEELTQTKDIVLVEVVGKSKVKNIYDEAMICKNADLAIRGYIII